MLTKFSIPVLLIFVGSFVFSCKTSVNQLVLPSGSVDQGQILFSSLHCNECHSIGDKILWTGGKDSGMPHIPLGGAVRTSKSYADLVTSIINPSHRIPEVYEQLGEVRLPGNRSKMEMYNYNEVMSVQELIDIVTFLQQEYRIVVPNRKAYH